MTHSHTHTHAHRAHVQMHFASYAQSWTESLHGSDPIKWTLQASPHRCRSDMCSARARHLPMAPALACAHASRLYASTSRAVVQARVGPLLRLPRLASGLPTIGRTRATIHCCAVFSLVLRGGNCLVATRGAAGAVGVYGARSSSAKPAL